MPKFIINKNAQAAGEHEVHNLSANCGHLPLAENRVPLGDHLTCKEAVAHARARFSGSTIDGCAYCAPACHTR